MKKLGTIVFLLLYLLSLSGVSVSSHYCYGRLASVSIQLNSDAGGQSSHKDKKGCCTNITHFFKVHDAQQPSISNANFNAPTLQLHTILPVINAWAALYSPDRPHNTFFFQSPPLQTSLPLFIRNESFLI